jgi:TolB-like protein/tetratricopeptide (TPR) repeat protein
MMSPAPPPGTPPSNRAAGPEPPNSVAPELRPAVVPGLAYADFAAATKQALRDFHSADLLAQNPLLRDGIATLSASFGPAELRAMLTETVETLFGNSRDEKLRRVIELTYFQPALKQEAVADRLSLPFGTYRRYLTTARDRLSHWLWESLSEAASKPEPPSMARTPAEAEHVKSETAASAANGSAPPRLSVVILPFINIGGNPDHDHYVDGITESLTTDLSRRPGVFAISRNTAVAYKGKPIDTRQLGRELGVRYVLEGSVQHAGNWIRINAQLIDTESGAHLWAERFDKPRANLLDLQDEVTTRLARSVHVVLIASESERAAREHPDRLDAVDNALLGWATWHKNPSLEGARSARRFFEAALRLEEDNVDALLGFVNAHMWEVNLYLSEDRGGQIRAAEPAAMKALALAPDSADAHVTFGTLLYGMRAPERALREFEFAIELDRNLAVAHGYVGLMKFFLGRAHETRGHVEEAIRLSPRDPLLFHWHYVIGVADIYIVRVVRALESLRKAIEINPNWALSHFVLAAGFAMAGLLADAADACAIARRLAPNFTVAKFRAQAVSDNPVYLTQRERLYEGLLLAGVPES